MSAEAVARRLYDEVWNARDEHAAEAAAGSVYHPTYTNASAPGLSGPVAKLAVVRGYRSTFPDLRVEVEDLVASTHRVASRLCFTGTDRGGFRGRPATGREVRVWTTEFLDLDEDLRVVSDWVGSDWLGTLVQLGVVADPWS